MFAAGVHTSHPATLTILNAQWQAKTIVSTLHISFLVYRKWLKYAAVWHSRVWRCLTDQSVSLSHCYAILAKIKKPESYELRHDRRYRTSTANLCLSLWTNLSVIALVYAWSIQRYTMDHKPFTKQLDCTLAHESKIYFLTATRHQWPYLIPVFGLHFG